jgi:hypothetical protein
VQFHEHPEHARTLRLVERLRQERVLRHPPIVAELAEERYLLLDGANRVSAFAELAYPQIPVQVIDYSDPAVKLKGWHHLLVEGRKLDLHGVYDAIPGVETRRVSQQQIGSLLELRAAYALLVDPSGACWGLFPEDPAHGFSLRPWVQVLERVVAAYEGRTELERIKMADYSGLPHVFDSVEHQLCLFPVFTKIELLDLARDGILIPTGLTRHIVPGRALSLNVALEFLNDLPSDEERSAFFAHFVERLEVEGRIRLYEEAVFILNE